MTQAFTGYASKNVQSDEMNILLLNVGSLIDENRRRNISDFVAKNSIDILFLTGVANRRLQRH